MLWVRLVEVLIRRSFNISKSDTFCVSSFPTHFWSLSISCMNYPVQFFFMRKLIAFSISYLTQNAHYALWCNQGLSLYARVLTYSNNFLTEQSNLLRYERLLLNANFYVSVVIETRKTSYSHGSSDPCYMSFCSYQSLERHACSNLWYATTRSFQKMTYSAANKHKNKTPLKASKICFHLSIFFWMIEVKKFNAEGFK